MIVFGGSLVEVMFPKLIEAATPPKATEGKDVFGAAPLRNLSYTQFIPPLAGPIGRFNCEVRKAAIRRNGPSPAGLVGAVRSTGLPLARTDFGPLR
ncbi:MAG TPA: hypothetical protein DCE44_18655 [Verrucomicrobiales bacterium]|nr:hypothetical protein [Verrucomicrobiales bacterium]